MAIVGVEKLYFAKLIKDEDDILTYDDPVYLPGVKEIGVAPSTNTAKLYAENKIWEQDTALDEVAVTLNVADLSNAHAAELLGQTSAAEGGVFATDGDEAPYVALLYKANKTNGRLRYQVLYKGKFALPEENAKTKEGTTEFQTPTMTAVFQSTKYQIDIDGKKKSLWKYQVDSDDPDCPETIDTDFFASVIQPTEKVATIPEG